MVFSNPTTNLRANAFIEVALGSWSILSDPGANLSLYRRAFADLPIPLANEIMSRKSLTDKLVTSKNGVHSLQ